MGVRKKLPKALRQQTWLKYIGNNFETKCLIEWCQNKINPFNFEVGHNIPSSKGGSDDINNLRPICSQCNKSMGNQFTIDEFIKLGCNENGGGSGSIINSTNKTHTIVKMIFYCFFKPEKK